MSLELRVLWKNLWESFLFRMTQEHKNVFHFSNKNCCNFAVFFLTIVSTFGYISTKKIRVQKVKLHKKNLGGSIEIKEASVSSIIGRLSWVNLKKKIIFLFFIVFKILILFTLLEHSSSHFSSGKIWLTFVGS